MKLIDEKGKLFGKINVIDFSVILFLFFILPIFYFGYKIFITKSLSVSVLEKKKSRPFLEVYIYAKIVELEPDVLSQIAVGDKEIDNTGVVIGEIVWVGDSRPYQREFNIGTNEILTINDQTLKEISVGIKIKAEIRSNSLYYKEKPIMTGSLFNFNTNKYDLTAVTELMREGEVIEANYIEINCKFINLDSEVIKFISVGDKEFDKEGQVIGEIINLGKITPYVYEQGTDEKRTGSPDLKQISARLKLMGKIGEDSLYYYKDKPIMFNSPLDFRTNNYNIIAIPVDIENIKANKNEEITALYVTLVQEKTVDLYITLKDISEDVLKLISVGDKEVDEHGRIITEILAVGKIENSVINVDLGNNNFATAEDSYRKQISLKMRLKVQIKSNNQMFFKGKKLTVSSFIEFNTAKYKAIGIVSKFYEMPPAIEEKWVNLQVKFSGVISEISNIIAAGDTEKDPMGKIVGRLNKIISNKPSEVLVIEEDDFIALSHPFNKDILASLDFLCIDRDGVLYFKNYPVKIGNTITFTTDLYSISGLIIGIERK